MAVCAKRVLMYTVVVSLIAAFASAQHANVGRPERGRFKVATNAGGSADFNGTVSWGGSGIEAPIRNASATTATGPLRIVLFYSSSIYPASGSIVAATANIPSIPPGGTVNVDLSWSINTSSHCFYWSTLLQEDVGGTWETDDYINYISPCSINPDHGPAAGGNTVTFGGRNLARVTTVKFGNTATAIQNKTETSIVVIAPAHSPGDVVALLSDSSGSSGMDYTYDNDPPQISSLSPTSGPAAGGNQVTINGTNLQPVTTVKFDTTSASIVSKSATKIIVTAPAHAPGQVTVKVDSPGGSATKTYLYESPAPNISRIDPPKGSTAGGETVTITGVNLGDVTSATFGTANAEIRSKSSTKLVVISPPNPAGRLDVKVRSSAGSATAKFIYEDPAGEKQLLPVVGSLAGNLGSFFRTSLQLHNQSDKPLAGSLVFHPQGQSPSSADPSLAYTIAPGETKFWNDILQAMNTSGLGSLDLQASPGLPAPQSLVRIFNDGGALGTTGMTIDFMTEATALPAGTSAVLVAPYDTAAFRFNIGIRALGSGVSMNVVVRDASGAVTRTVSKQYDPNSFVQTSASAIAGGDLLANESLRFDILSGSAMIYGATTDNLTQDPSYQLARRAPEFGNDTMVVAVTGSVAGNFGSFFRTAMQMHNPHAAPLRVRAYYHPQGASGSAADPAATFTLAPGETRFFSDLVATLGASGVGSVDLVLLDGLVPIVITRIYNDAGAKGTTGMTLDAYTTPNALGTGDKAVLIAPSSPVDFRYNIGVRTLGGPTTIEFVLRGADGTVRKTVEKAYGSDYFIQVGARDLFGETIGANDAITVNVRSGTALVYGAATDNRTQDPNVQVAKAP